MSDLQLPSFWQNKRVILTGGAGFLGSFVTEKLKLNSAVDIFIPHIEDYNLVDPNDIRRLFINSLKDVDPKNVIVIHLAANVGGIAPLNASNFGQITNDISGTGLTAGDYRVVQLAMKFIF